jgi:hypothetical protein
MANQQQVLSEVGKTLDDAIEGLRWCRQHMQERGVTHRLRQLQITLSSVALALDYEMDGQTAKAELAMEHADWRPRPQQPFSHWTWDVH